MRVRRRILAALVILGCGGGAGKMSGFAPGLGGAGGSDQAGSDGAGGLGGTAGEVGVDAAPVDGPSGSDAIGMVADAFVPADARGDTGLADAADLARDVAVDRAPDVAVDRTPDAAVDAAPRASKIEHVVLIVQENHTFDSYFGRYCQAPPGSNPTCTDGPACCERAPAQEPMGASPLVLDDTTNFAHDLDHEQACEVQQLDGGKMDRFVRGTTDATTCDGIVLAPCSSANNWAMADASTVGPYWDLARDNALADRYFQPIAGASSANDMYFATAHFQFVDNSRIPDAIGSSAFCLLASQCLDGAKTKYEGRKTIADLLIAAGKDFAVYADGYDVAKAAGYGSCATAPSDCPYASCFAHPVACHACIYDAADNPFAYYSQLADGPLMKDYAALATDLADGRLPAFSFVKARAFRNEHPNVSKISDGVAFVSDTIARIQASSFASRTLILLTWDEGGGFYDHVPPPPGIDVDDTGATVPYGTRVPLLAIGPFARKGAVSHVPLEHSSIVRFLEYNFLGAEGQLGHNDAKVHNLGSLLDPATTGITIPE